jgi:hypothetical protein
MARELLLILATSDSFEAMSRSRCELKSFSVASVSSVVDLAA